MTDVQKFQRFVEAYPMEIPPAAVEEQLKLLVMEEKQRIQYDRLTGKDMHLYAQQELAEQMESLEKEAFRTVKESLVLKRLVEEHDFQVSEEELADEAAAIAARQNTAVEELRRFFGEELTMLRQELRERKAIAFVCEQTPA